MDKLLALSRDFEISYTQDTEDDTPWEVVVWEVAPYPFISVMVNGNTLEETLADALRQLNEE